MNPRLITVALAVAMASGVQAAGTSAKAAVSTNVGPTTQAPSQEQCSAYMARVTESLKEATHYRAMSEGGIDNSVPRLTMAAIQQQSALAQMSMNLQTMLSAGCPAPAALNFSQYWTKARACAAGLQIGVHLGPQNPSNIPACDRDKW